MINPSELNLSTLPWLPLEAKSAFPRKPAIYFAIDSQDSIQYIGRSNDVRERWKNHHRYEELAAIGGVRVVYLFIEAPELLPEIEAALIDWFQPQLNLISSGRGAASFDSEQVVSVPGLSKRLQELWISGGKRGFNRFSISKVSRHLDLTECYWRKLLNGETGDSISVDLLRKIEGFFSVDFGVKFND